MKGTHNPSVNDILEDVSCEFVSALYKYPSFNSAHEGYAVLKEEVDELWEQVKVKQGKRDVNEMRQEAIQIAAMAVRFIFDICNDERGNK